MFKEKILAQLVTKFPGVSKKFLGLWADKLQSKVTEESQIEGVVNELDNLPIPITELATEFQKEADQRVTAAEAKWKKENPPKAEEGKKGGKEGEGEKKPEATEPPEWAKTMIAELQSLKTEKLQSSISQKLTGHEKLKDIPAKFWNKRKQPEKEEEIDAFVDEVANDYTEFKNGLAEEGFSQTQKPVVGSKTTGGGKDEKVSPEMKAYLEKKNKTETVKN